MPRTPIIYFIFLLLENIDSILLIIFLFRYVFWYHNDRMVNYDLERGVSVTTIKGSSSVPSHPILGSSTDSKDYDIGGNILGSVGGKGGSKSADQSTKSRLIITEANPQDSGNYTCKPSNAVPASIQVFVSKNRGNQNLKTN